MPGHRHEPVRAGRQGTGKADAKRPGPRSAGHAPPVELDLPLPVPFGLEDRVLRVTSEESLQDYHSLLNDFYPESKAEIALIISQIQKMMHYMDVQYGIDREGRWSANS